MGLVIGQRYNFLFWTIHNKDWIDIAYYLNTLSDGLYNSITDGFETNKSKLIIILNIYEPLWSKIKVL